MNAKQIVLLFFIAAGLGCILFFTFDHFRKEEARMLENASNNKLQEELDKKEKENQKEQEEKVKQEVGQNQVNTLLENLQNTQKIVLSLANENGKIDSLNSLNKYIEVKTITNENRIQEILNSLNKSVWQENKNTNFIGKLWQFYDKEENLILEYNGHSLVTKETEVNISISLEEENKLNGYFVEE